MLILCCGLLLSGCAQPPEKSEDGRLQVVAAVFPAYDFARAAGGGLADVELLLPPGAESHSYEPTPADILAVQECDLFIYLGGESDTWVETILSSIDMEGRTLRMVDCVELLEETEVEGMQALPGHRHDHEDEEGEEHGAHGLGVVVGMDEHVWTSPRNAAAITRTIGGVLGELDPHEDEEGEEHGAHGLGVVVGMDEHVWTSPRNAAAITRTIGGVLGELDPTNAPAYAAAAEQYAGEIDGLDGEFAAFFGSRPDRTIVFGDRFPLLYFAEEFDLDYYAAFPGCGAQTEPSAATVAFLTDKVRQEQLPTVWYIEFSNHLVADSIAEAAGVGTAMFHTCHNVSGQELERGETYVSLMRKNLETLREYL